MFKRALLVVSLALSAIIFSAGAATAAINAQPAMTSAEASYTVTAGSQIDPAYAGANIHDGDTGTAWWSSSTNPPLVWLVLNTQQPRPVLGARFYVTSGAAGVLRLEYFDGIVWRRFAALANLAQLTPGWNQFDLSASRAGIMTNRLRIVIENPNGLPKVGGISEFIWLAGNAFARVILPVSFSESSQSSAPSVGPEKLFDGNTYSIWPGVPENGQVQTTMDLGGFFELSRIKLYFKDAVTGSVRVEYEDNGTWSSLPGCAPLAAPIAGRWNTISLPSGITAQRVRLVIAASGKVTYLSEVEIWGKPVSPAPVGVRYQASQIANLSAGSTTADFRVSVPEVHRDWTYELSVLVEGTGPNASCIINGRSLDIYPTSINGMTIYSGNASESVLAGNNYIRLTMVGEVAVRDVVIQAHPRNGFTFPTMFMDSIWFPTPELAYLVDGYDLTPSGLTCSPAFKTPTDVNSVHLMGVYPQGYPVNMSSYVGETSVSVPTQNQYLSNDLRIDVLDNAFPANEDFVGLDYPQGAPPAGCYLAEVIVEGSPVTMGYPTLTVLSPQADEFLEFIGLIDGEAVDPFYMVTGYVDNPACQIYVNNVLVPNNDGHFSYRLLRNSLPNDDVQTIVVKAVDPQGNTVTNSIRVFTVPKPSLTCSLDQLTYTSQGSITVSGQTDDRTTVTVNGLSVTNSKGSFTTTLSLQAGYNDVVITSTSSTGVVSTLHRTVIWDKNAPEVQVTSHFSGEQVNPTNTTISGLIGDLQDCTVTVAGLAATVNGDTFVCSGVPLQEGRNDLIIIATEKVTGRTTQKTLTLWLHSSIPALTVTSPANGLLLKTATVTVSGTASDELPVSVRVNDRAAVLNNGAFSLELLLIEGSNTITVTATDEAGNEKSETRGVMVDTLPPEPFTVTADPSGWSTNPSPVLSFGTYDAGSGLDRYEISIDGGAFQPVTSPHTLAALADGEHPVVVRAVDRAGNITSAELTVSVDTTPPAAPEVVRVIPGRDHIVVNWKPSADADVQQYRIERTVLRETGPEVLEPVVVQANVNEITESDLEYGVDYQYRVIAIDRVALESAPTAWHAGQVALAKATYNRAEGTVVEYENVTMAVPKEALPADVVEVRIQEVQSENFTEKATNPIWSPIYEFSVVKEGSTEPETGTTLEQGVLVKLKFDPAAM